ncbi:MAG: signal recognition particle-docking protein FtsY [Prosthecochloris sp.]|uniref:Signal recognition particle receptor FtsY n=1 Tax=Prosthecochloris aestuarii (strain DSM 271 / SK 413) TaxID=290512 RepID=B4S4E2_PROA2|nr:MULTISPECIES: signal recognition particle-docking protein FtsY [Prosthecochloris]ACF45390.1 signal recognition particle-docking protein FtsY [Prosthecochloris aestuarii DSM 271]MCW8797477.1 signal recognition particle-docking protein FtsY [Prosthecochloris sp.]NEX12721.1 signal recognition particle-docking protein FtsY [Prosthecochloris sp.]RDD31418.1 signal recognition particle-docking protein FtsY [Prosthecochloris sp. ZM]
MGFFDKLKLSRLKDGLTKTRETIRDNISRLTQGRTEIDEEFLEELENILIAADVGVETTLSIVDRITERAKEETYRSEDELNNMLLQVMQEMLLDASEDHPVDFDASLPAKPYVILIVGVNGVGKTTSIAKLAHNYHKSGKKVMIAAADTFRAAAVEQLQIWADRAGVPMVSQGQGADPASVVFDAVSSAVAREADVVLVDTAGRLHNKAYLMEELAKIMRVAKKKVPEAPHEVLLVLDGTTGQNAVSQAREFTKCVNVTGLIITKLDGTAKGGIVLSISRDLHLPVKYIGVGEKIDDLQIFDRSKFVGALMGKA